MKKTKILTVLGVLLAMGITACGGSKKSSEAPAPSSSSQQPAPSSSVVPSSSSQPTPQKDATGHIWGADADVAASGEGVAYKKATCTENDGWIRLKINQSAVTYASGSSRKENTPEGYTKLDGNGQSMSAKFNYDHYAEGRLYLFGCMDGWGSNASKKAFSYNGSPNIEVKVNGEALDIAALSDVVYTDFLSGDASDYSDDGYGLIGNIKLDEGVNEVSYKRLASMNTLIKDFVFVIENKTKPAHVHTADAEWHKDATNHWHECTAGDGFKMDSAAHTFGEWVETASAQPCKTKGTKVRTCSVCGYEETGEIDLAEHTWVADTSKEDIPATCIAGKHFEKCSVCGETREVAIPKDPDAAHDFGEWEVVTAASCKQGQKKRTCSRCGMEEFGVIPPAEGAEHVWGEKETVADVTHVDDSDPENPKTIIDYVGYDKYVCQTCGTWKVVMKASKATLDKYMDGTTEKTSELKANDDIEGGMKLSKNNMSFSFKFNFPQLADIVVYQHGCMDNYKDGGNVDVTYYTHSVQSGWQSVKTHGQATPNFEFLVNGVAIDTSELKDVRADQVVNMRADDDPLKEKNYSTLEDVLIGESELVVGDNTFTYKRLQSYNYIITDIVVLVTPVDHVHEAGENWVDTDANYHWKNCTHSDGHKMLKAPHDYTGAEWEIVKDSTCTEKGLRRRACIVCGHWQEEEIALKEHTWVADESKADVPATCAAGIHYEKCSVCGATRETPIAPAEDHGWVDGTAVQNSDSKNVIPMTCSKGCGKVAAKMSVNDYSSCEAFEKDADKAADNIRPTAGKYIEYKIVVAEAGNYSITLGMKNTKNGTEAMNRRGFQVKVGTTSATVKDYGSVTADDLGLNGTTPVEVVLVESVALAQGENTIQIICGGYRVYYAGNLSVYQN